jgi:prepilin-type N-terminal cleavage/methylation domain-containing protein
MNVKGQTSRQKGFSLIEILVVMSIFAALAVIATQSLVTSLNGVKKTDNSAKVRQSLDFALSVIERQLRNADSVNCGANRIDYVDKDGVSTSFSYDSYSQSIASGSSLLTSDAILVTSASFICTPATSTVPPSVTVNIVGREQGPQTAESAVIDVSTKIYLRTY